MIARSRKVRHLVLAAASLAALVLAPLAAPASAAPVGLTAAASTGTPKCAAADLGVWVAADQSEGAAGTIYTPLQFTNLSRHTCTLFGFPGVSAISSSGQQLGNPAVWERAGKPSVVRLAPGATAHAILGYVDAVTGNCPPGKSQNAAQLRVYPPDQYQADHALWSLPTCSAQGYSTFLRVGALRPGIGRMGDPF